MKLKRIRKVEYDEKGEAIIKATEHHLYDVHFIDNEDWLCIDEDDYTEAKKAARNEERVKHLMKKYAISSGGLPMPTGMVYYSKIVILPMPTGMVYYSKKVIAESVKTTQTVDKMITIDRL